MVRLIQAKVYGLQCDNLDCDYTNPDVEFADYKWWIDRPCPKCGQSLLTQKDHDDCLNLLARFERINVWCDKWFPDWLLKRLDPNNPRNKNKNLNFVSKKGNPRRYRRVK